MRTLKNGRPLVLLCLSVLALFSCHAPEQAPTSTSITLYRLDGEAGPAPDQDDTFHDWKILEECTFTDQGMQQALLTALQVGIDDPDARQSRCFIPRHGIRHQRADGLTMDHVICFQCSSYRAYLDAQRESGGTIGRTELSPAFTRLLDACHAKSYSISNQESRQ